VRGCGFLVVGGVGVWLEVQLLGVPGSPYPSRNLLASVKEGSKEGGLDIISEPITPGRIWNEMWVWGPVTKNLDVLPEGKALS